MKLEDISWPVFKIGTNKPVIENNIVFYITEYYIKDTATIVKSIRIIDDKNLDGATLGLRRLELFKRKQKLYRIKIALYFIGDLIKLATPNTWFIDNAGNCFQYKKTKKVKLLCFKIKQVLPAENSLGSVLELENHVHRYRCLFSPKTEKYVGLLSVDRGFILYALYNEPFKTTYRLI